MKRFPSLDVAIIFICLLSMILAGFYLSAKNKNWDHFTRATGSIPGWAIGLSIYAAFLSSNTFLGVPGKAFGTNWNAFVFSISNPFCCTGYFKILCSVYRRTGEVLLAFLTFAAYARITI